MSNDTQPLRFKLPTGPCHQCSLCGTPVDTVERVEVDGDVVIVRCEPCGHLDAISAAMIR